ncbi:S-adenosylmethionine decarboxylase related protein [Paenibacillus soyae]|uniref:S-adenosylmethionine decarboxylase related protein n=1 Tax=Paenibacillus soyae TaxID=2969249 RepID=A0A9X2SAH5_9BACL|nr:S-adenosylmethionine decarboxylase related protein [Paenibacillus soyae]MCR2804563.1 S-adenosylmethionine decarboxylase related protein [Paenibacillus soyae]
MKNGEWNISIFGSAGGVARSVLSLLNKSITEPDDPLYPRLNSCKLHLIDLNQKSIDYYERICPHLLERSTLYTLDLKDLGAVRKHVSDTRTALIIDLSWADTVDMLVICNELGITYVNSALEIVEVDENEDLEGFTLMERYLRFEVAKNNFTNMKGIVCSGMNPGVVQWMAHEMMEAYPNEKPLACYIVEKDSTFYQEKSIIRPDTLYSSWSPECYLDEAIDNYPVFVKQHMPLHLYSPVYSQEFKVTLGDIQFSGCLVPHEEVLTMGKLYDMELGFIYKVNDHTTKMIRDHIHRKDDLWDLNFKVFDPAEAQLVGEDLVGVLLVYKDKERYMYNVMDSQTTYLEFGTNATYMQVACGVYAGVCSLMLDKVPNGVYYVDELLRNLRGINYGKYVSQYMTRFVRGENEGSEGLLLDRIQKV